MTQDEVVDRCFDLYGIKNIWSCRCCGALVPTDRREMHLGYHLPDYRVMGPRGGWTGETTAAGWKIGIPPTWARKD